MKITAIYGAMPHYDGELGKVLGRVLDTLAELEVERESIALAFEQIPYYDGIGSKAAEDIIEKLKASDGVIFASAAMACGVAAPMATFLEHLTAKENAGAIRGKNCMAVVCGHDGGERDALDQLSRVINGLGAYDAVKIGLSPALSKGLSDDTAEIIDRQAEDFYRIVRQNRRFIIPGAGTAGGAAAVPAPAAPITLLPVPPLPPIPSLSPSIPEEPPTAGAAPPRQEQRARPDMSAVYEKLNLSAMTSQQERDIGDIAQRLSKKQGGEPSDARPSAVPQPGEQSKQPRREKKARLKTCRQMTQSLPHYFQPQMAAGFSAVIQINVNGPEKFEGHVKINNADCAYYEGAAAAPDITIISDAAVWNDVLTGKSSAQKAFMIGKLKVRGNFVVLTKLEQLFKPMT